ncbi:MAG TPA: PAS domain S-box protein, partial [Pirellulales bacterium]
ERAIADSAAPIRGTTGSILGAVLVFRDVTDDRRLECERDASFKAAENERRRLAAVLEALPTGVIIADANGRLTHFNQALYRIWGENAPQSRSPDEYGEWKGWWPKTGERIRSEEWAMSRALKTGEIVAGEEVEIERFDGGRATVLNMASPIRDAEGRIIGGVVAEIDLTERKQAQVRDALLARVEEAIRPLSNPLEITNAAARLLGQHLQANRCAYADVEADQDTFNLIGDYNDGVESIVGRYTFTQFGLECLRLLRSGEPYIVEDSENDPRTAETRESYRLTKIRAVVCVPVLKAGRFVAAMAVHQAESRYWQVDEIELVQAVAGRCWESIERARVERTLRESEERFRTLADNIAQFAWMANREGWMSWFNRRWFEYTGTTFADVRGWGWRDVIHPEHIDRVVDKMSLHWRTGEVWEDVFPLRSAQGEYRWFLSRAVPIRNEEGRVVHWFGTNTDITDRKQLEDHLREVAADLSEANRRKNEFLATLAHELRNPLAPIRTGLELLRMAGDDVEMIEETRSMMERQTQQMVRLIDDLLDVSRITQGKLQLRKCRVELADVIRNSVEATRPFIVESGHELSVSVPHEAIYLHADPNRLAQIFSNLLNNAAKYTKEGGKIRLTGKVEHGEVVVGVKDNGLGIPLDMQELIFEMFAQIDRSLERGFSGLGIGLTLVKRLVEMHGGSIEVHSEGANHGSEFVVRLPLVGDAPSSEMSFVAPLQLRKAVHRILVV